jgi:GNAT superfamily N-acetyltransferase
MDEVRLEQLPVGHRGLEQVEKLLVEMYAYMSDHGLLIPLAPNGEKKLRRAMEASLGKTGMLIAALKGDQVVGFTHGLLRIVPDYLDARLVGMIGHSYTVPEFRRRGLGRQMYVELKAWLVTKGAGSLELQVLTRNEEAIRFWESCGFAPELLQMRQLLAGQRTN